MPSVVVRLSPGDITQAATVTGTAPNYTWTASVSGLTDATYTVAARATDGMGNITDTAPQTLSINTAAPSATLSTIAGSAYTGTQILTNDATPTLAGTATGGGSASVSQVDISLDNGTTWSPATGTPNWSYTPSANLADTLYNVQVRVTNSVGTQSVTPFASAMRVDSAAPTGYSVTITPSVINLGNQTAFGFALLGAEVGSSYSYTLSSSGGGSPLTGTGTVTSASQSFSGINVSSLPDGTLTLSLTLTDTASNAGTPTTATVNKDTTGLTLSSLTATPSTLTNTGPLTFIAVFSGAIDPASFTNSDVGVTNGTLSSRTSSDNITWTITVTPSAGVTGTVGVAINNGAVSTTIGNPLSGGPYSATRPFDNVAPTVSIAITSPSAGTYSTGQVITAVATFSESVTGTADLKLQVGSNERTMTCSGTSGLTRDCTYALTSGDNGSMTILDDKLTGTLQDSAGNTAILAHGAVNPSITADTTAFTVSGVAVQSGGGNPNYLTSTSPTLRYTFSEAVNASSISASDFTPSSGSVASVTPVGSTPTTQYDVAFSGLSQGSLSVAIAGGSITSQTASKSITANTNTTYTVDSTAPTVSLAITSPSAGTYGAGQVITATATFSESVTGTASLPFTIGSAITSPQTCTGTGTTRSCSYTIQSTDSGAITIADNALTGTLNDAAGNPAILTHAAVNTPVITADTVPLIVSIPDLIAGDDTGSSSTDDITNQASVTLNGTAKAGSTVTLYTGSTCASGSEVGTPQTATGGTYSFASVALSAGSNTFSAGATDGVNTPVCSTAALTITRDSTAPSVAFTGSSSTISADTTTLSGTASDASGSGIFSVTASSSDGGPACSIGGTVTAWTCALNGITAGTYTYTAIATDIAGNTTTSTSFSLTRSTSAPTLSLSSSTPTLPTAGGLTNASTLSLSFTATPTGGATSISSVEVSTDGTTYSVPTIFSAGTWNTTTLPLTNDSSYTLKARATDNLSNVSTVLDIDSFTVDRTAPTITGMTAPANATYGSGQNLDFVATMSEATTVTGTPRIALSIGSTTQYATYLSGSGTTSLTFRYITQSGDNDTDGIAVTSPVQLNGGTLRDSASNDATLTFTPPTTTGVLVDTSAPTISSIAFSNTGCASNFCGPTNVVNVDVTFSENVTPSSLAATIPVTIGGTTTYTAAYASQLSATVLRFTKTIAATGSGESGALSTPASPTITLTGGTLTDTSGNTATLTSTLAAGSSGYTVDTTAPTVAFTATAGSYASGQTLGLTATYSEPVSISAGGNPSVPLTLTTGTLTATDTGGAATNVTTRTFTTGTIGASGTHQDIDSTLNVGTVALNSATITDAAGNALTLTPTPATVTGVTINAPVVATGGTITTTPDGLYRVHTFTTVGTSTFTVTGGTLSNVEYLVVGGGGGGGNCNGSSYWGTGGGGAGGMLSGLAVLSSQAYTITVGAGGASNSNGGNSAFDIFATAVGGGRGGNALGFSNRTGGSGGSGGGGGGYAAAAGSSTAGQGNQGGTAPGGSDNGGGGGGAGAIGGNASGSLAGHGGIGLQNSITGSSIYYSGGGAGGSGNNTSWSSGGSGGGGDTNQAGMNGRGGGGAGGQGVGTAGKSGGSGVVIIRYPI
jgi:hypothetical protein